MFKTLIATHLNGAFARLFHSEANTSLQEASNQYLVSNINMQRAVR